MLEAGTYPLLVSVYDIYGNTNTMTIQVTVRDVGGLPEGMFIVLVVGVFTAITVGGFIGILFIRKRRSG